MQAIWSTVAIVYELDFLVLRVRVRNQHTLLAVSLQEYDGVAVGDSLSGAFILGKREVQYPTPKVDRQRMNRIKK